MFRRFAFQFQGPAKKVGPHHGCVTRDMGGVAHTFLVCATVTGRLAPEVPLVRWVKGDDFLGGAM